MITTWRKRINLRKAILLLVLGVACSLTIIHFSKPGSYSEKLIRLQVEQELAHIDPKILDLPVDTQAQLLDYLGDDELVLKTWIALSKYPDWSRNVLELYGSEPEFKEVMRTYGDAAIPVIQYFLDHDVWTVRALDAAQGVVESARDKATEVWSRLKGAPNPPPQAPTPRHEIAPKDRGWYAVNFIRKEGHQFLGQFVINKNKKVTWLNTDRVVSFVTTVFTSGIRSYEAKKALDEEITTTDIFFAGVDVIPIVVSLKLLRAGKLVANSGKEIRVVSRTRMFGARLIPKGAAFKALGKYGTVLATGYVVLMHPDLINSLLAELAGWVGWNPAVVQFLGWLVIFMAVVYPFSWLLLPCWRIAKISFALGKRAAMGLHKLMTSASSPAREA
ncbi:MAG: hypothetical protein EG825_01875 [Rhodocyclaceae bacterium]|nr:hypothetical protein [Rhodocyclaceae bacterium]